MKKKPILALLLALTMTMAIAACSPAGNQPTGAPTPGVSAAPLEAPMLADFSNGPVEAFFASDGWSNGSVFNVFWKDSQVTYTGGQLHLGIADVKGEVEQDYYGGEVRTGLYYGYGDYIVSMKPVKQSGTVSTFFTCTGPYDINADGEPLPPMTRPSLPNISAAKLRTSPTPSSRPCWAAPSLTDTGAARWR